ncbi:hypothetical protein ES703_94350 [subsurface metagenome]
MNFIKIFKLVNCLFAFYSCLTNSHKHRQLPGFPGLQVDINLQRATTIVCYS